MRSGKCLVKVGERGGELLALLGGVACGIMFVIVTYDVLRRYFFNVSTEWVLDLSMLLMLPVTYLGAAAVAKRRGHVHVDILASHLSQRNRIVQDIIASVCGLVFAGLIIWQGFVVTVDFFVRGVLSWGAYLPVYPAASLMFLGGVFFFWQLLSEIGSGVCSLTGRGGSR